MADNKNSNLLMDAVHGNTAAITQLAGNLNCDFNALNGAICDVRGGVDRLSGQVGFSAERVINSVSHGNLQMIQALKDCLLLSTLLLRKNKKLRQGLKLLKVLFKK